MKQQGTFLLEEVINLTPGNVYWKDVDGVYLGCNNNVSKILGLDSPSEIIGRTNYNLFDKDLADLATMIDKKVFETGETIVEEEIGIGVDGNPAIYLTTKAPLRNTNGEIFGLIGSSIDITHRKSCEEKAKQMEYMRIAAGAMAHDLRTPLASIQFSMEGIKKFLRPLVDAYKLAKNHKLKVEHIRADKLRVLEAYTKKSGREIAFANNYIDLMLSNLTYNCIDDKNYKTLNATKIINSALESYPFEENESKLVHWNAEGNFDFWGDENLLKNIVYNLLKNSFYFIKKNGRGEIFIWIECEKDFNTLHFKDTAEGASPEIIEHMFDGFYSTKEGGTGLGLASCKSSMQSFGGDIYANSVAGEFIEFILQFPTSK